MMADTTPVLVMATGVQLVEKDMMTAKQRRIRSHMNYLTRNKNSSDAII